MSHMGKSHLIIMFTVGPDDVAEGDRIFASHGEFMKGSPREGDTALLGYTVSRGPELSNPMDASSEPTGNTTFVVDEYYESPAGITKHWQDTTEKSGEMTSAAPAWFARPRSSRCTTGQSFRHSDTRFDAGTDACRRWVRGRLPAAQGRYSYPHPDSCSAPLASAPRPERGASARDEPRA